MGPCFSFTLNVSTTFPVSSIFRKNSKNVSHAVRFHTGLLFSFDFHLNLNKPLLAVSYVSSFLHPESELRGTLIFPKLLGLIQVAQKLLTKQNSKKGSFKCGAATLPRQGLLSVSPSKKH